MEENKRIDELDALDTPVNDDLLVIFDTSADDTKSVRWDQLPSGGGGGGVSSVNGRTGAVTGLAEKAELDMVENELFQDLQDGDTATLAAANTYADTGLATKVDNTRLSTSATNDTVALRKSSGRVETGTATDGADAVNLTQMNTAVGSKLTQQATASTVYGINSSSTQVQIAYNSSVSNNSIPVRTTTGQVQGSDPTAASHLTTKSYVDTGLAGKENTLTKGSIIAGSNVSISGTLTNRLVGAGDITINSSGGGGGGGAVDSVNGQSGIVLLNQDNIPDGTTAKQFTQTEKTKLSGIEAGAEVNEVSTADLTSGLATKQDTLVSATNIKTINGTTILGSGNIATPNTTYSAITQANIENPASTTAGLVTGQRASQAVAAHAPVKSVNGKTGVVVVDKADVGLPNVDNTSDLAKPISTATQAALDNKTFKPDLISTIAYPHYSAHRGGPLVYPEASMEAYEQVAKSSFSMECDVRALSDGTLVLLHDETVNRTMTNVTGNVSSLTLQQWRGGRINPVVATSQSGTPVVFSEFLDRFGGEKLIIAELKDYAAITPFINMIKEKSLEESIIAAAFDWTVAQDLAAAGLHTMFCIGTSTTVTPTDMTTAGVEFLCAQQATTGATLTPYKTAGIKALAYTVNTSGDATTAFGKGFDGVVSDNPWAISGRLPLADTKYLDGVWRNWTPSFTQTDSMTVSAVVVDSARYMTIGNTIYCNLNATFTVGGTVDAYLQVSGMPFAPRVITGYTMVGNGFAFWPALSNVIVHSPLGTPGFLNIHQAPAVNWTAGASRQLVVQFSYEF